VTGLAIHAMAMLSRAHQCPNDLNLKVPLLNRFGKQRTAYANNERAVAPEHSS
jgi:hypothetical protein